MLWPARRARRWRGAARPRRRRRRRADARRRDAPVQDGACRAGARPVHGHYLREHRVSRSAELCVDGVGVDAMPRTINGTGHGVTGVTGRFMRHTGSPSVDRGSTTRPQTRKLKAQLRTFVLFPRWQECACFALECLTRR